MLHAQLSAPSLADAGFMLACFLVAIAGLAAAPYAISAAMRAIARRRRARDEALPVTATHA